MLSEAIVVVGVVRDFEIAAALRAKGTLIDSWKIEMK